MGEQVGGPPAGMALDEKRLPIFSAREIGQKIGYVEGDGAFDLAGNKCAYYDRATGNLRDTSGSGKVIGHITLQRKFIGASWIAQKLFPRLEGYKDEPEQQTSPATETPLSDDAEQALAMVQETLKVGWKG